ncbi:protein IDA-LIKE 2-like [Cicer arietinum]|uniref:Protein IDA-LIKE 2-like n=1 Tax=Cicer arietinum TaxID=3827 RepID=A0A1S3E7X2_CICAR|nr:protein IDA-LIKE 2-like [Cicer arietinum]
MVQCIKKLQISLLLLFILLLCIFGYCHGSRTNNVFKAKPKYQHTGHFFGFLPRRIPIPFSSPSRKHNDIGLQRWKSP